MLIRGRMRSDGPMVDVCIRNVSKNGMMLQAPQAPRRGAYVEVRLPEDTIVGQVVWSSERRFGIRTRDRVPVWRLIGRPAPVEHPTDNLRVSMVRGGVARAHSDARYIGRAAEFLFVAAAIMAVAGFVAFMGYQALSDVTSEITTHL